ncbi:hypothetical protein SBA1_1470017 [Candidatus Sulfotelmatobacter kueseliae]|uniref:Uncharacterized protein n=1 Tax=Candidatus Sulfotelmatobacter kueseliae TaxID=2042962 RepID=A0A2U3K8D5_9BACT|nr:hypothetical protein SBA1_1470017 [Candidatus Sulfotelmatobacter kueseliae]
MVELLNDFNHCRELLLERLLFPTWRGPEIKATRGVPLDMVGSDPSIETPTFLHQDHYRVYPKTVRIILRWALEGPSCGAYPPMQNIRQ